VGWTVCQVRPVHCIGPDGAALQAGPGVRWPGDDEGSGLRRGRLEAVGVGSLAGAVVGERRGWRAGELLGGRALCDADRRPVPSMTGCWVLMLGGAGAATATWASC